MQRRFHSRPECSRRRLQLDRQRHSFLLCATRWPAFRLSLGSLQALPALSRENLLSPKARQEVHRPEKCGHCRELQQPLLRRCDPPLSAYPFRQSEREALPFCERGQGLQVGNSPGRSSHTVRSKKVSSVFFQFFLLLSAGYLERNSSVCFIFRAFCYTSTSAATG